VDSCDLSDKDISDRVASLAKLINIDREEACFAFDSYFKGPIQKVWNEERGKKAKRLWGKS